MKRLQNNTDVCDDSTSEKKIKASILFIGKSEKLQELRFLSSALQTFSGKTSLK
jgi:hypothetical protein